MKKCIVVGSGKSATNFNPPDNITIFAVNGVSEWISRMDYWFTLDPSDVNLKRIENPAQGAKYYLAVDNEDIDYYSKKYPHVKLLTRCGKEYLNKTSVSSAVRTTHNGRRLIRVRKKNIYTVVGGIQLSDDSSCIQTGNSAFGAVGLAYKLGYTDILLIGVDGRSTDKRIEGGFSDDLSHLPRLFDSVVNQVNLYNGGYLQSDVIPKMSIERFINL